MQDDTDVDHDIQKSEVKTCDVRRCGCCIHIRHCNTYLTSSVTKRTYKVINLNEILSCNSKNIIYLVTCNRCKIQYVGETKNMLKTRMNKHRSDIKCKTSNLHISKHFKHTKKTLKIQLHN